jgi:hypothetical protein
MLLHDRMQYHFSFRLAYFYILILKAMSET